ncbi:MAG: N-acetylmuramoyl-L-alanine amidase [Oscillospiraceae bacterium]|nr:N-acetylmuramoyl-L-alanine amidase [Oscillospiraceae bacterium]
MRKENWVGFLPFYVLTVIIFIGIAMVGSRATTAITQNTPIERAHTIVIDAGHGGIDGGATSCSGVLESKLNLDIALRLEAVLQLLGFDTRMIRTTDTSVYTEGNTIASQKVSDLKERVRIVEDTPNALLVSIHQNTYPDGRYSGAQVFYGGADDSKSLAQTLQANLNQTLCRGSNRKSKQANGVYLMQNISCTGVLIECGFLTNPREEARLRSESYQKQLCCVIASTLSIFAHTQDEG